MKLSRVFYRIYKILGAMIIAVAIFLVTVRLLLSYAAPRQAEWIHYRFPYPLKIQTLHFDFLGWKPIVTLEGVEVYTPTQQLALRLDQVKLVFNPYRAIFHHIVLEDLQVEGVQATLQYHPATNMLAIADLPKLTWSAKPVGHFSVSHIHLQHGNFYLRVGENQAFPLEDIDFQMKSNKIYVQGKKIPLGQIVKEMSSFFPFSLPAFSESIALSAWGTFEKNGNVKIVSKWAIADAQGRAVIKTEPCGQEEICAHLEAWNINIEKMLPLQNWQGKGDYFSAKVKKTPTGIIPLYGMLRFSEGKIPESQTIPGIEGLEGTLSYRDKKIMLALKSHDLTLHYAPWFEKTLSLGQVNATFQLSPCQASACHIQGQWQSSWGNTSGNIAFDRMNDQLQYIDLSLQSSEGSLREALAFLPQKIMDKILVTWLDSALLAGNITQMAIRFQGEVEKFPFDNQEGIFQADITLDNAMLNYDPRWPLLSQMQAQLQFRNRQMTVIVNQAAIAGGTLHYAKATISDLKAPLAQLQVESQFSYQLDQAFTLIQNSPLKERIGRSLSVLTCDGPIEGTLHLDIPLTTKATSIPVKVKGSLTVENAEVSVPRWNMQATDINGTVRFTDEAIEATGLKGKWLEENTLFSIGTRVKGEEKIFEIQMKGHATQDKLMQWLAKSEGLKEIQGGADYVATLAVPSKPEDHALQLTIVSSLQGVEIKAPPPFGKEKAAEKPSMFQVAWEPGKTAQLSMEYGEGSQAQVFMEEKDNQWQFQKGYLHIGSRSSEEHFQEGIFLIEGELEELDVEQWRKQWQQSSDLSKMPVQPCLTLDIHKLITKGETFLNTHIQAKWDNMAKIWSMNFDGSSLKGQATVPQGEDQREIVIDLKRLVINTQDKETTPWLEKETETLIQRPMEIKIKKLKFDNRVITDFQARVEPSWRGYDIPRLQGKLKNTEILLSGQWDVLSHTKQVAAEGKIITHNISDFLKAIGRKGSIHQAKGSVEFSLYWQGTPFAIDYPTLTGKASFQLTKGYIQGMDPGIGRVLNLLSVDTMQRRLNLDFSDVTKNGFVFDEMMGKVQFGKGKISSNGVSLRGPSANIEGYGQADWESQILKGELIVMPNVTGSLPVAAAIAAGNPAVGAAVWIVDKMVGKKLQEIHRYRYRLAGTWNAPKLEDYIMDELAHY